MRHGRSGRLFCAIEAPTAADSNNAAMVFVPLNFKSALIFAATPQAGKDFSAFPWERRHPVRHKDTKTRRIAKDFFASSCLRGEIFFWLRPGCSVAKEDVGTTTWLWS